MRAYRKTLSASYLSCHSAVSGDISHTYLFTAKEKTVTTGNRINLPEQGIYAHDFF
jgi:hypothetical protein